MAITKEQIFAEADALDAAGINPTLAAIRKAVGGGSFTTISQAMTEWKARRTSRVQLREPVPQSMLAEMTEMVERLWSVGLDTANERLSTEREQLAQEKADLECARQEAADLADELSQDLEESQQQLHRTQAEYRELKQGHDALQSELATEKTRAQVAEARLDELRKELEYARSEIKELKMTVGEKDRLIGGYQEEAAELRGRLQELKR